ncbi:RCC1 domain-containing protein [Paenibacillus silviterrae]|uniref:RCC1 domain-containing protein n=1 Tax=Paenibacillus silviterrae TaxID=3242194 RepID=UPI0025432560|nr:fibronectin type III domain-containing protein [Paenibacillus chinjuensis]
MNFQASSIKGWVHAWLAFLLVVSTLFPFSGHASAQIQPPPGYEKITGSSSHTVALAKDGTVWAWGKNDLYQLGDGTNAGSAYTQSSYTTSHSLIMKQVAGLSNVVDVKAGGSYTLALTGTGEVYIWGTLASYGGLQSTTPTKVPGLPTITAIAASQSTAYAIGSDKKLYAWGNGPFGELGYGSVSESATPIIVKDQTDSELTDIIQVAAGSNHALALRSDGKVFAWGANYSGQLGDGTTNSANLAAEVFNGMTWISADSTSPRSFAYGGGKLYGWGSNGNGELGLGNTDNRNVPTEIPLPAGKTPVSVSSGISHTIMMMSDGTTYGAGSNYNKQITDDLWTRQYLSFIQVASEVTGIKSIQAASSRNFVVTTSGAAWGWGANAEGYYPTYWFGFINPNLYEYMDLGSPAQLIPLQAYPDADLQPKAVMNPGVQLYNDNEMLFQYTIPPLSKIDKVLIRVYKMDGTPVPLVGVEGNPIDYFKGYGFSGSEFQTLHSDMGFDPGQFYKVTFQTMAGDVEGPVVNVDNGGAGYYITPGNSSISLQVNQWNSGAILPASSGITVKASRQGSRYRTTGETDENGRVTFSNMYPGQYQIRVYDDLEEFVYYEDYVYIEGSTTYSATLIPFGQPYQLEFVDGDPAKGKIGGTMYWMKSDYYAEQHFKAYFEKSDGTTAGSLGEVIAGQLTSNYYLGIPQGTAIPADAVGIRLYLVNGGETRTAAYTPLLDNTEFKPNHFGMADMNPLEGVVRPKFTWNASQDESTFDNYVIVFKNSSYKPYVLARVPKSGAATYEVTLSKEWNEPPDDLFHLTVEKDGYISREYMPAMYWDQVPADAPLPYSIGEVTSPSNLSFTDLDPDSDQIGGELTWNAPSSENRYAVYFLNESGSPVQSIGIVDPYGASYYSSLMRVMIPMNTQVPAGAKKIGIYTLNDWSEERSLPGTVLLSGLPSNPVFPNKTASVTQVTYHSAEVHWMAATDENGIAAYKIILKNPYLGTVLRTETGSGETLHYQLEGLLPDTAYGIEIKAMDTLGNESLDNPVVNFITAPLPHESGIIGLTVSSGASLIGPTVNNNVYSYTIERTPGTVPILSGQIYGASQVSVTADTYSLMPDGSFTVSVATANSFTISVVNTYGSIKTYEFGVSDPGASSAILSFLKLDDEDVTNQVLTYGYSKRIVPFTQTSITLTAATTASGAQIKVNGNSYNGQPLSISLPNTGLFPNTVEIQVISATGSVRIYYALINREPADPGFLELFATDMQTKITRIEPVNYSALVANETSTVKLAFNHSPSAHLVVRGGVVNGGYLEPAGTLQSGSNIMEVDVIQGNAVVKTYSIDIFRSVPLNTTVGISPSTKVVGMGSGISMNLGGASIAANASIKTQEITTPDLSNMDPLKFKQAGKVIDFTLSGVTIDPNHPVELTMPFSGDARKAAIYYYNSETRKWEYQQSRIKDYTRGTITIHATHFSQYGVFEADEVLVNERHTISDVNYHIRNRVDVTEDGVFDRADVLFQLRHIGSVRVLEPLLQ